jgi:nitrogen fixation/metabolism regulation signal transduction histidine kinase
MAAKNSGGPSARIARKRLRILYQVTALLVVVVLASSLIYFFLYRSSLNRLAEKSEEKVIQTEGENFSTSFRFIAALINESLEKDLEHMSFQQIYNEFYQALEEFQETDMQKAVNEKLKQFVDSGVLGLETAMMVVFPKGILTDLLEAPLVLFCSDNDLLFSRDIPEYWDKAAEEGQTYLLLEDGIPELGLSGEYLVTLSPYREKITNVELLSVGLKPVREELAEISDYFDQEKRNINFLIFLVIAGTVIIVILITFFILSYLIRKSITKPVDELAATAGEVMEGNLDVEIEVHEGSDFEGLERAFKEMVESLRRMIERAVGE